MSCDGCLHQFVELGNKECRRNPPQVVHSEWLLEKPIRKATTAELMDERNWIIVSRFPGVIAKCGDYVQSVHGL